jgi:hypothetical protein
MRNLFIHPDDRQVKGAPAWIDAWRLSQWYLELLVLHLVGYTGDYLDRRPNGSEWAGDTRRPPWCP